MEFEVNPQGTVGQNVILTADVGHEVLVARLPFAVIRDSADRPERPVTLSDAILVATANCPQISLIIKEKIAAGLMARSEEGREIVILDNSDFESAGVTLKTSVLDL